MLIGFLAMDGTYTECEPWAHLTTAQTICKEQFGKILNGIAAEDYLYDQGYVIFYARGASNRFLRNDCFCPLSTEQLDFIIGHLKESNNEDQRTEIENMLRQHEGISGDSILDYYESEKL